MNKKQIGVSGLGDSGKKAAHYIPALIIAVVGMLLYANTINHEYVLDDVAAISQNSFVHEGIKGIPEILKNSYWFGFSGVHDITYRPVPLIMYAVEWQLSPGNPLLSHLVNILLYGATGFLLFFTLKKFVNDRNDLLPFLTAILFIAHPIHTEVVANIKSRDEMLSFFFSILSLYFLMNHLKNFSSRTLVSSLACFFLALISKENAVTLLAVVPLVIYFFSGKPTAKNVTVTASFIAVFVLYIGLRLSLPEGLATQRPLPVADNSLMAAPDLGSRMATAVSMLGRYLILLVFPYHLLSDYSYQTIPIVDWNDWGALLALLIHLIVFLYAAIHFKRKSILSFAILFYFVTISVSSNIFFLTGATMAERFLYMPSLGFCLAIGVLLSKGQQQSRESSHKSFMKMVGRMSPLLGLAGILFLLYSFKTITRNNDWKNNRTLFSKDLQASPKSCKLNYYYAVSLLEYVSYNPESQGMDRGSMIDSAMNALQRSIAISGGFLEAYEELGYGYFMKGYPELAKQTYEGCVQKGSHGAKFYNNYAMACMDSKDYIKAIELLRKSIEQNPNYSEAFNNLGALYNTRGMYGDAVPYFQKAIDINPRFAGAYKNIARSYANLKNYDAAISSLKKAMEITPDDPNIYLYLGYSYKYKGDSAMSKMYFRQSDSLVKARKAVGEKI